MTNFIETRSDEELGQMVKRLYSSFNAKAIEKEIPLSMICSLMLIDIAVRNNAEKASFSLSSVTLGDENVGDWKVTLKKIKTKE